MWAGAVAEPLLRVPAVRGTVPAGQPLRAAPGRALHRHGPQRAAPSLVSRNPSTGWGRAGETKGDVGSDLRRVLPLTLQWFYWKIRFLSLFHSGMSQEREKLFYLHPFARFKTVLNGIWENSFFFFHYFKALI